MEYRVMGRTGVRVSALALGTANFADPTPEDEAKQILERAVDAGINLIDTGDSYAKGETERIIGRVLKGSGLRKQVLLSTKVFPPTGSGPNDRGKTQRTGNLPRSTSRLEQARCGRVLPPSSRVGREARMRPLACFRLAPLAGAGHPEAP